jgi:hypothetical protein
MNVDIGTEAAQFPEKDKEGFQDPPTIVWRALIKP